MAVYPYGWTAFDSSLYFIFRVNRTSIGGADSEAHEFDCNL